MNKEYGIRSRKIPAKSAFAAAVLCVFFLVIGLPAVSAQQAERSAGEGAPVAKVPVAQGPLRQVNPYFSTQTFTYSDGTTLERAVINGPPTPPPGFESERAAVSLPEPDKAAAAKTLTVPAYNWVFGCSSVSGAMIAAYYDRNGCPNMYTGPTGGGVMPMDNSSWPTWSDGYTTYPNLPLAASHNGVDGRATRGSIDDYWVKYYSPPDVPYDDPYITNGWTQHAWGTAIGDYMKTSQSAYGNTDGSTTFYTWTSSATQLTCSDMVSYSIHTIDGTYGRKLFYEARGYTVTDCYNQKTDNNGGGFTFAHYKAQIDAGRPVMLNLYGHTIVGVGYNDTGNTVYMHDTWNYSTHTMTWGGSYSGMVLQSVSIVNIQGAPVVCTYSISPTSASVNGSSGSGTVTVTASGGSCAWTASSNTAWITVTSGASGTGSGTVGYSYTANNTGDQRTGTITIAGKTFTLTQKKKAGLSWLLLLLE